MDFEIEEVRALDAVWPDLVRLMLGQIEFHRPYVRRELRPDWQERWREHVKLNDDRLILIAREAGVCVGYVNAGVTRDYGLFEEAYGLIGDAYVRAQSRRRGLGAALVAQVEEWCRARGVDEVRVGVVVANDLGVAFWLKSGFKPLTYTMSKSLAGSAS